MVTYTSDINNTSDLDTLLWGGAADKWHHASNIQKDEIFCILEDIFRDGAKSLTDINDFIWFDCDDIFYGSDQ